MYSMIYLMLNIIIPKMSEEAAKKAEKIIEIK